ncbi:MAG: CCA tRNA nucleotidyltransferase [Thermoproteota archaeon]|nr:CCA tRNA nucleotidyltransferase [Thermoproteota archaeon]
MTDINSVISKALQLCQPSPKEVQHLTEIAEEAMKLLRQYYSPMITDVVLGGSFAKGTWLKRKDIHDNSVKSEGCTDIDIFIKIDVSLQDEEFDELAKKIAKQSLSGYNPRLRYSSHPYVEAYVKGIRVNVVPCYNVEKGRWKSAADRSPFHTEYIRNNLDDEKKNQVRLLKKFLKSIGVYGAEIATAGFSGYVTEILILKYGSFVSVLKAISNIKEDKNVISIGKFDEDVLKIFQSPIIIIDPIDSRRNLGTAISAESVGKAVLAARAFLEKPSLDFFREKKERYNETFKEIYSNLLIVEFFYRQRSPDIIWGQIKRTLNAISKQLCIANFTVIRSIGDIDEKGHATFVFLLEAITLPPYMARTGPHIFRRNDTTSFISENIKKSLLMWIDNEMKVKSLVERKTTNAKEYVKLILANKKDVGVTKGLIEDIQETLQIYTGDEKEIHGLVKNAIYKLITTDSRIFR